MQGDTSVMVWVALAGVFIIALAAGLFIAKGSKAAAPSNSGERVKRTINETKNNYKDYRDSVHGEFKELNDTIKEMNSAYGDLYQHLASGGVKLSLSSAELKKLMTQDSDFIARLPHIKADSK